MKKIPRANYQTAEELDARIKAREAEAASLPSGEARQSILKEVAQLRAYADVKRWLAGGLQSESKPTRPAPRGGDAPELRS